MRVVFMGSAEFSCPSLGALLGMDGVEVVGAVTQPDRPRGRNLETAASPVRKMAAAHGVPVLAPERVNSESSTASIADLAPDLIVVVAYGQILKPRILRIPPEGCINVHASLLPRYRGAAPIQWAIARGEKTTGITIMFMAEGMDTGDIILQRETEIGAEETGGELHDRLAVIGADALGAAIELFRAGGVTHRAQDEAGATLAPKVRKEDGEIDWTLGAEDIYNRVRAFNPWPCARCRMGGGLRVLAVRVERAGGEPGTVLDISGDGPVVAAGEDAVRLVEVQPDGKKVMKGAAYLRGHRVEVGESLI